MSDGGTPDQAAPLPLDAWHRAHGGRMVPFAGHAMPIQYQGILAEHQWTRAHAGLFDVSHMGQIAIGGEGAGAALERLLPADLVALTPGRIRYSLLLDEAGGVLDDLLIANTGGDGGDAFYLVVNGATKAADIAHLKGNLPTDILFTHLDDRALLALQGPEAAAVIDILLPGISAQIGFMQTVVRAWNGVTIRIGRSGYTGEDGFEISLPAEAAERFADALLVDERVKPIGLGARDSLRLEAGLPLYGHDLAPHIDPVSAGLTFAISKRRRETLGFPGAEPIIRKLAEGAPTRRVGLTFDDRAPAREGATVHAGDQIVGHVTSGGFSPTLGHPIAMAYVAAAHTQTGTRLSVEVRGRMLGATVVPLPFVPHRYHRAGA